MSGIKPFGRFWDLDGDGFIVNDASGRKIPRDYLPAVSSSVSAYRDHLRGAGVYVRGIYLRGTVARGIPVRDVSDLDLFALVDDRANLDLPGMDGVERGLLEEYPMLGGAGLEVVSGGDLGDGEYFSEADLLLSSQSVRLFGEDVIVRLPRFEPGVLVANNDVFQISTDIREGILGVESDPSPEFTREYGLLGQEGLQEHDPGRLLSHVAGSSPEESPFHTGSLPLLCGVLEGISSSAKLDAPGNRVRCLTPATPRRDAGLPQRLRRLALGGGRWLA